MATATLSATHRHPANLSVRTRGVALSEYLEDVVRSSVSAAIGRFSHRIRGVFVWVEDTNGPKGGRGLRCRIDIRLKQGDRLVVSADGENEYVAVGRAAARARTRLVRRIGRLRRSRRGPALAAAAL